MNTIEQYLAEIRMKVVELSHMGRTPHLGSSLSCVDLMGILYREFLNIDPENPDDPKRDRFILSKGHAVTTLYSILAKEGFFSESELDKNYVSYGGAFPEHPSRWSVPGIEASTGSLGHGLSLGVGITLGHQIQAVPAKTYVLISDGECNEGSTWEAAMTAPALGLTNLCAIVDFNKWQATGRSAEVLSLEPLDRKFEAFGWEVVRIDGHDVDAIREAYQGFQNRDSERPMVIIADTIKGKGISFMEDDNNWHYRIPKTEELVHCRKELGLS